MESEQLLKYWLSTECFEPQQAMHGQQLSLKLRSRSLLKCADVKEPKFTEAALLPIV